MSIEPMRGCGYRRAGGIYLVGGKGGEPCDRLPIPIIPCPMCKHEVEQTRGFQWIERKLLDAGNMCPRLERFAKGSEDEAARRHCVPCPICNPNDERFGLRWVGEKFYPTAEDWLNERDALGASMRIPAIPKGFEIGKTWVLVAHPKGYVTTETIPPTTGELAGHDELRYAPGVIHAFCPEIEVVVTPTMRKQDWVKKLVQRGARIVEVPENDPDHAPVATKKSARKRAMDRHANFIRRQKPVEIQGSL